MGSDRFLGLHIWPVVSTEGGEWVCEMTVRPRPPILPKAPAYGGAYSIKYDEVAGFNHEAYFEYPGKVARYEGEGIEVIRGKGKPRIP